MKNVNIGFMLFCFGMIVLDLLLKIYVSSNINVGHRSPIIDEFLAILYTITYTTMFSTNPTHILRNLFKVLPIIIFYFSQTRDVNKYLKYSSILLLFGVLGNFLDRLLIGGKLMSSYQHMNYLLIVPIKNTYNISSILTSIGWYLFLIAMVMELYSRFKKTTPKKR